MRVLDERAKPVGRRAMHTEVSGREVRVEPPERVLRRIRLGRFRQRLLNPLAAQEVPCEHSAVMVKPLLGGGIG